MTGPKQNVQVSAEKFEAIVDFLEERLRKFLRREARVGHSTRITGHSRIDDVELHRRLARLRDFTRAQLSGARQFFDEHPELADSASQFPPPNEAENALKEENYAPFHERTIYKKLVTLQCEIDVVISLTNSVSAGIGESIAPGCPIDLMTADEVEAAFEGEPNVELLLGLLRINHQMRSAADEVMALLKGRFLSTEKRRGPHERRRGSWITAHLVGLAEGLGLQLTRNYSPQQQTPLRSAADAVAIVIGRLRDEMHRCQTVSRDFDDWLDDPVVHAVLDELPRNRGRDFDSQDVANGIIRKIIRSKDVSTVQARHVGKHIGERESENHAFKSYSPANS